MKYEEALEVLKRGGNVTRGGRTYKIARGVQDVTDPGTPVRVYFNDDDRAASDWEEAPEVVAPETVDEALHETIPG
jgi:hypothetical protein